jgi:hypothetical protein
MRLNYDISSTKIDNELVRIVFKSSTTTARTSPTTPLNATVKTLAECTLQPEQAVFKCESLTRTFFCKLALNTSDLACTTQNLKNTAGNLSFPEVSTFPSFITKLTEFGQSLVQERASRADIVKYGLIPFRLNLVEMDAGFGAQGCRSIVLDYVIPVFGSWNALSLYYEKVADVFRVGTRDLGCYSELISMLNEASPFFSALATAPSSRRLSKPNATRHV